MKVKCVKLDDFGNGIAYVNEKIVFIPNLLPNEEAIIKMEKDNKKYSFALVEKLIFKSKYRDESFCCYNNCGCHLKNLVYKKQLEYKEEKVKNIINKFTGLTPKINKIIYFNNCFYRNKVTLKVNNKLGYFENKSNKLIPINKCMIASEKINNIISVLNKLDLSNVKEITIKDFEQTMLIVKGKLDISSLSDVDTIYLNDKLVKGNSFIKTSIKDLKFVITKDSFFQVNKYLLEKLYDVVVNYCGQDPNKKVLDLYCGTGTITLLLSKYFKEVIGIEINSEAIKCALKNKEINNINNVNFICSDASKIDKIVADIIVIDPPRSGLTKETIKHILNINPSKIVYVSCNPITLSRDLNVLKENYVIKEITPVDMFPNTYHVECVCLLERRLALIK